MKAKINYKDKIFEVDLDQPIDISIPLVSGQTGPNCFYAPPYEKSPVKTDEFVGSIKEGGLVNFYNLKINPHGNGTHTECVGHIAEGNYLINDCLKTFHFPSLLISVDLSKKKDGDLVITKEALESQLADKEILPALIVRTIPNDESKLTRNYSGTNPPYFAPEAVKWINEQGIDHLLTDLPSIDREVDGGKLTSHKNFWNFEQQIEVHKTITELIFVDNKIQDGLYLLNLMIGNYDLDASPSKVILYETL